MNKEEFDQHFKGKSIIEKLAMGLVAECLCIERFVQREVPRERLTDYICTMAAVYVVRCMQAGINEVMKKTVERDMPTELALLSIELNLNEEFSKGFPQLNNIREALLKDYPNADRK